MWIYSLAKVNPAGAYIDAMKARHDSESREARRYDSGVHADSDKAQRSLRRLVASLARWLHLFAPESPAPASPRPEVSMPL